MVEKYYLINDKRLCKGYILHALCIKAEELVDGQWVEIKACEINDRLLGFDPSEELGWQMGHKDIMDEIQEVSVEAIGDFLRV